MATDDSNLSQSGVRVALRAIEPKDSEAHQLVQRALPGKASDQEQVLETASDVLAEGIDPIGTGSAIRTGLVVGHVQSGKTLSFEAVAGLARDIGYQLVILIAGRSNLLLEQSTQRFRADLDVSNTQRSRRWLCIKNASASNCLSQLSDALDTWRESAAPEYVKRTVLITVLKHQDRICEVTRLLETYVSGRNLDHFDGPALIIDDEADQASLDIDTDEKESSAIHTSILDLRSVLRRHTYLQYTATPQAPLLISTRDQLSADFARVLDPGPDYIGGDELLLERERQLTTIPKYEVERINEGSIRPPPTLVEALRIFAIGISAGLQKFQNSGNRSMLVHPSRSRAVHEACVGMISSVWERWDADLRGSLISITNLRDEFHHTYERMCRNVGPGKLMGFDDIWTGLRWALRQTQILEVNTRQTGRTPHPDWLSYYAHILVGGDAINRGFTVEGLTVTYLSRSIGSGNADTIQQRARFYGYRHSYIDYCHVFLDKEVRDALVSYVPHEHHFRQALGDLAREDVPLQDWPRRFVLDPSLRPCRQSVLSDPLFRRDYAERWVTSARVAASAGGNRHLVERWIRNIRELDFVADSDRPHWTPEEKVDIAAGCPLAIVARWLAQDTEERPYKDALALMAELGEILAEYPSTTCAVYRMSRGAPRKRSVGPNGEIVTGLFQGENPIEGYSKGEYYPGDRSVFDEDTNCVTLQLHYVIPTGDGSHLSDEPVPIPAIRIPAELTQGRNWVFRE